MESNGRLVVIPSRAGPADSPGPDASTTLACRPWYRTTSREPGLLDIRPAAGEPLPPHLAVRYWRGREAAARGRLGALGVPWAFVVDCDLADLSSLAAALVDAPVPAHLLLSIAEDEIFRNVDAARSSLSALRGLGAAIRVTGCGTRFFAMAGYRPLPVDQVVFDTLLRTESDSSAIKTYWVITDIIRRAGATIFTQCPAPPRWLAAAGVDFCAAPEGGWCKIPATEAPAAAQHKGSWRKVGLHELARPNAPAAFASRFV